MNTKLKRMIEPCPVVVLRRISIFSILVTALLTICGCGAQCVGNYESTIRLKRGIENNGDESLETELAKATERTKGFVEKLHIKGGGRYWQKNVDREFDGDWWIAEDGRLATRITHQNGKSLGALISDGADRHWEIGSDGNLYRYWNNPDSNLEFVFVKQ